MISKGKLFYMSLVGHNQYQFSFKIDIALLSNKHSKSFILIIKDKLSSFSLFFQSL